MSDSGAQTETQLSTLPGPTTYLTGHDTTTGLSVIHSARPANWTRHDSNRLAMAVAYTTSFPADLNADADIAAHDAKMKSSIGLVSAGGTVLRFVDFAPGYECLMHRTKSVDYGIVVEGQLTAVMDSGEERVLQRGDVMVQRATMHAWRNDGGDWARMVFVLQDCKPLVVAGKSLGEDLGSGTGRDGIPPSGNDV